MAARPGDAEDSGASRTPQAHPSGYIMNRILRRGCLVAAVAAALALPACGGSAGGPPPARQSTPSGAGPSATPAPAPSSPGSPQQTSAPAAAWLPAGYLPLYPFSSLANAHAWQASYRSGGHQPWHVNAGMTATAFAAWLGYTGVDQVAHQTVNGDDARVTVGYTLPNGKTASAAVVHLIRVSSGKDAPWEVVGTDDTTFSLDTPGYGSTAGSPVTVGGTITGVDENIRAGVYGLTYGTPAGTYCCRAAGGTRSPWSATVTFHAPAGQVLTIAAATGGHVAAVERFAVTGIRAG
jgi:hypothetical protein